MLLQDVRGAIADYNRVIEMNPNYLVAYFVTEVFLNSSIGDNESAF
jgi:hypothetical protein